MDGFWWTPIIPVAAATLAARFAGQPLFNAQLKAAGFGHVSWVVPSQTLVTKEK